MKQRLACCITFVALLAGCSPAPMPDPAPGSAPKQDAMAPADVTAAEPVANDLGTAVADGWLGEWRGPEGTSLRIDKQEVGYALVIANLDGPREFHGIAAGEVIEFERDGIAETLRAGDGAATGMKWLAGKKDCLVVKPGEGYCRD